MCEYDNNMVDPDDRCPKCGERNCNMLIVTATEHICCTACGTHYRPGAAARLWESLNPKLRGAIIVGMKADQETKA